MYLSRYSVASDRGRLGVQRGSRSRVALTSVSRVRVESATTAPLSRVRRSGCPSPQDRLERQRVHSAPRAPAALLRKKFPLSGAFVFLGSCFTCSACSCLRDSYNPYPFRAERQQCATLRQRL